MNASDEQRKIFPRGLKQPDQGFRFSLDSLLLASFIRLPQKKDVHGIDLGSGCGVIGFALLLEHVMINMQILGMDLQEEMVRCAQANALSLGMDSIICFKQKDLSKYQSPSDFFDFAVANPPYRLLHTGRKSNQEAKNMARFELHGSLDIFCKAAATALKDKAFFSFVYLPERLGEALDICRAYSLSPQRVRFVHSRAKQPAKIMLMETRKNSKGSLSVEAPLVLYQGQGKSTRMSEEALAFCPYLRCTAQ